MLEIRKYNLPLGNYYYLLLITILYFLLYTSANSQDIVISEYFNGQTPADDWTELLVTADNISLEFYILRDYRDIAGGPTERSWGIQFNQHSLWRDIRAGTIIIIHHRGTDLIDINKNDGYIEIGAENSQYFTKVNPEGVWEDEALDIRQDTTIIRIENSSGVHVHSLSHMAFVNSTYLSFPLPKLNFPGICPPGESISVAPGANLSEYDGEVNSQRCSVSQTGNFVTMGKPNKRQNSTTDNLKFWQLLRTPVWINTQLNTVVKPDFVELSWSPTSDNYNDAVQGYLILRILQKDIALVQTPANGTTYNKGDSLGSALVVDNENASLTTSYTDSFYFDCNDSYVYRIYAYRYNVDDLLGNKIAPSNGRGRTYNFINFAEATVRKTLPAKPTITVENNKTQFCSGDSLLLTAIVFGGPYIYEWFLNTIPLPNSNRKTFYAKNTGWYKVKITNEKGCSSESDAIQLSEMPSPTAVITFEGRQIKSDTILTCCENESHLLIVSGGDRFEWFKDYVKLPNTTNQLVINQDGIYFAVAINNGMVCTDTSVRITLDVNHVNYNFDKDTLYYYLDKYTRFEDQAVRISNSSSDTLIFKEIIIPAGGVFSMFVPPPSEVVPPNRSKDYTIRFEPNRSGIYFDSITFVLPCKNAIKIVYLFAQKERMNVEANPTIATFDTLVACDGDSVELLISIINNENFDIEVDEPKTELPFSVITTGFPKTLISNNSLTLKIQFKTSVAGNYNKFLTVPFSANGVKDGIIIQLNGKALSSSYRLEYYGQPLTEIEFPALTGCDDSTYSAFQIFNTGEVDLEFSNMNDIPGIYFSSLPIKVKPKSSKEIQILFVPQQEGNFLETLYIATEPCSYIDSVILKGSKQGITYGLDKQKISFSQIINCITPGKIKDSINLIVSGKSQVTPTISKITGPKNNYFSHTFIQNMSLPDTNKFYVSLEATAEGEYSDTIKILINPCDFEKTIPLYAKRINPHITLSNDTLNFGLVPIETRDTNYITITNSGEIEFTIEDIRTSLSPFSLLTSMPLTLLPDSLIDVLFEYAPLQVKNDNLKLNILMSEPCTINNDMWLIGRGDVPKYIAAEVSVPEITIGELAKEVMIPVSIISLGTRTLDEAKISEVDISLRYNPTLLYPKSISIGNAIVTSSKNTLEFDETPPGLLNIKSKLDTNTVMKNGNLFDIKFLTLLGNSKTSSILFEKVEIKSSIDVVHDTISGIFQLTGGCSLDERLLNLEGSFDLYLISENPVRGETAELVAELPYEAVTELKIVDVNGYNLLSLMKGIYPPGKYFLNFDTKTFSDGTYIVQLNHGNLSITKRFVILK